MSNFAFIRAEWPEVFDSCVRAEANLTLDPRAACFYARRAGELITDIIYDSAGLPLPVDSSFASCTKAPAFRREVGGKIEAKLRLLRLTGNDAVHSGQILTPSDSRHLLTELFHLVIWAAQRYTDLPVPLDAQFDTKLAGQVAPVPREAVAELLKKRKATDDKRAVKLAEAEDALEKAREEAKAKDAAHVAALAEKDAQLKAAQDELAAVRARRAAADTHDYEEDTTRTRLIDRDLRRAGWSRANNNIVEEREVHGMPVTPGRSTGTGYVDYVLLGADGVPVGVVEAKRTRRSATEGEHQATLYADCLEQETGQRPLIFCTNGYEIWLKDDAAGYPARRVQGFYTPKEIERLILRRGTGLNARRPLDKEKINADIAGRPYQVRAIRAVGHAFDQRRRAALLVMATGSGKTRTTIALVDQMMKANWARRVLFLADRKALVKQARNAFATHLPNETTVNLLANKGDRGGRIYLSTYPTMMNLIEAEEFDPGYFDLIVIDEAHRSVYAKYRFIFEYFDSLLLGLTATPKDQVDHNTYGLFDLPDGEPTDAFTLEEAVAGGYLVPPKGLRVETTYLRQGIRYDDLSAEQQAEWDLKDWGEDAETPDAVTSHELNRYLFNTNTVDLVLRRLMEEGHKVEDGERLAKTVIFAKNQRHADFIVERFRAGWPELGPEFAQVITHSVDYAEDLIDTFADPSKHSLTIAVSVDMLDTGIDVPEVANLVFFKEVHSETKFWQMIGRGTRLCPDLYGPGRDKEDFLVFDFCGNLEYFSQELPPAPENPQRSLTQRITEARLGMVRALDERGGPDTAELRRSTADELFRFISGMNPDNVIVRPHRREVERYGAEEFWTGGTALSDADVEAVVDLAGLPSGGGIATDTDTDAKRFDLVMLTAQLARETGETKKLTQIGEKTQAVASELLGLTNIHTVKEQAVLLEMVASEDWWVDVTSVMLEEARLRLRGLLHLIGRKSRNPVYTDFEDEIRATEEMTVGPGGLAGLGGTSGLNLDKLRDRARAYLLLHEDNLVLQRLQRGGQLTPADLDSLEDMLEDAAGEDSDADQVDRVIGEAAASAGGLGLFIRSIVGLDRATVSGKFAEFLDRTTKNIDQIRFVETIIDELTVNGVVEPGRLFEDPYTGIIPDVLDESSGFDVADLTKIRTILVDFKKSAVPAGVA